LIFFISAPVNVKENENEQFSRIRSLF